MDSRLEARPWDVSSLTLQKKGALLSEPQAEMKTKVFRAFPVGCDSPWAIENLLVCEHLGDACWQESALSPMYLKQTSQAAGPIDS